MEVGQPNYVGRFRKVTHFEAVFFSILALSTWGLALIPWYLLVTNRKETEIRVYSDRLEINASFIRKRVNRIEAGKIEGVVFNEGIIGKSKYGSVKISGTGMKQISLTPVINPEELANAIRNISNSPRFAGGPTESTDLVSAIEDLKRLHTAGILSDDEFAKAKAKLF
jgi:hypothetical protein